MSNPEFLSYAAAPDVQLLDPTGPRDFWPWKRPKSPKYSRVLQTPRVRNPRPLSTAGVLRPPPVRDAKAHQPPVLLSPLSLSPLSKETAFLQLLSRPKHIPIEIPNYVPVAPDSPCYSLDSSRSPRTPTSLNSNRISCVDFASASRTSSNSNESGKSRPRHVEIVIPSWAQPVTTLPITPPASNPSRRSSCQSSTSSAPYRIPQLPEMSRQTPNTSRTNTLDSNTSAPSPPQLYAGDYRQGPHYINSVNSSQTSLNRMNVQDSENEREPRSAAARTPGSAIASAGPSPAILQTAGLATPSQSTSGLSGLVCNVHRTTGREPYPLVGATTTILGDKLYVFGGRRLSRTRPQLTADLYELDLVRRHWTKLETTGQLPAPRYFHSVCALGDSKLVCYGGMSPAPTTTAQVQQQSNGQEQQPEVVVMQDIHIYDVPTRTWMAIPTQDAPQGRYAHCATILPSSAQFASPSAPLAAINHNPSSQNPNQGQLGVSLDGSGGAEMVVVGGQDSGNHYIEQISVFNLRSLRWTATNTLGRSCGAYRSVVAPLHTMDASKIGQGRSPSNDNQSDPQQDRRSTNGGSSMLIYSNYNFLDVKLELQVRMPDGTLTEKPMQGTFSPPGLRFPNGGIINNHFVVSGTFLTSSKQEYALWALDLRTLTWSRIDAGGSIFSQGSWNRGVLWNRRNTFVILGNRNRSLVEDYNHRRINFSNICMVELEAFGLYDNPRRCLPTSGYVSISAPAQAEQRIDSMAGGRQLSTAAEELGSIALGVRELADMDIMTLGGERIPINSHMVARRWGPYFNQLLREGTSNSENTDTGTLRPSNASSHPSRNSSITITPSIKTAYSASTITNNTGSAPTVNSDGASTITAVNSINSASANTSFDPPDARIHSPTSRPRTLYLPHTVSTINALTHYLYTSSLPPSNSALCTPQILCSLLQIARPYRVDGLLEAVIERLHAVLDGRNTAAIFNASAMAAGGGEGVHFRVNSGAPAAAASTAGSTGARPSVDSTTSGPAESTAPGSTVANIEGLRSLRIDTANINGSGRRPSNPGPGPGRQDDEVSSAGTSTDTSEQSSDGVGSRRMEDREVWMGEISAVIGLQKRGLRGLMEGRRQRDMARGGPGSAGVDGEGGGGRIGLGIA